MALPPALRRAMLAAHIICSVGWIGAAAAYLALGVAAEVNMQPQIVRAAWIGMELSGWFVIVPLGCLALLTGLVVSLGTPGAVQALLGRHGLGVDDAVTGRPAAAYAQRQHPGRPCTECRRCRCQPTWR
jgi:hypothetical protein